MGKLGQVGHSPTYLLGLAVEDVRCFGPKQVLDLSDGAGRPIRWTIILGDNGVGKTTLLQCLAKMAPDSGERSHHVAKQAMLLPRDLEPSFVESHFSILDAFTRGDNHELSSNQAELSLSWYNGTNLTGPHLPTTSGRYSLRFSRFAVSWDVLGSTLETLVCYGYGATRRAGAASLSDSPIVSGSASLFSDGVELLNAEEWLLQADYSAAVDSPIRDQARVRRDQVREVLINLLPDVSEIRFARPTEFGQKPRVEVQVPYGWVRISDLSLGYRALVAWIVDFAYRMFERYPESENPLAEPAIVLVDEIDLHLHPKWQRSLISYLTERFPNTQFIVTAHSPLIVQAATDANIVLLRREGDHVVIDNDVEAIRGWRIDQVLTSDLFGLETARPPEYDELLAERTKLLGKAKLTKKDQARLKKLEADIGDLPAGESLADIEAMDVIRRAAEVLKREGTNGR